MEILLLIFGIVVLGLVLFRPGPQPQVIYVPMEVVPARGGHLGCLPAIVVIVLIVLALGGMRF